MYTQTHLIVLATSTTSFFTTTPYLAWRYCIHLRGHGIRLVAHVYVCICLCSIWCWRYWNRKKWRKKKTMRHKWPSNTGVYIYIYMPIPLHRPPDYTFWRKSIPSPLLPKLLGSIAWFWRIELNYCIVIIMPCLFHVLTPQSLASNMVTAWLLSLSLSLSHTHPHIHTHTHIPQQDMHWKWI